MVYTFEQGQFSGRIMEEVLLRDAPALYREIAWAKVKGIDRKLLRHFRKLRRMLKRARIEAICDRRDPDERYSDGKECKKRARYATFANGPIGESPDLQFWCQLHCPPEDRLPINFDITELCTGAAEKEVCENIKQALGIMRGTLITEAFARTFFAKLSLSKYGVGRKREERR